MGPDRPFEWSYDFWIEQETEQEPRWLKVNPTIKEFSIETEEKNMKNIQDAIDKQFSITIPADYDAKIEDREIIFTKRNKLVNARMVVTPYILKERYHRDRPTLRVEKPGARILVDIVGGRALSRTMAYYTKEQHSNASTLIRRINGPDPYFKWVDDDESIADLKHIAMEAFNDNIIFGNYSGIHVTLEEVEINAGT